MGHDWRAVRESRLAQPEWQQGPDRSVDAQGPGPPCSAGLREAVSAEDVGFASLFRLRFCGLRSLGCVFLEKSLRRGCEEDAD